MVILTVALLFESVNDKATFIGQAQFASYSVAAILVLYGAWQFRRSRATAYGWFLRAILVNVFVTQMFAFLESQLGAVGGLFINLLVYAAIRFLWKREYNMSDEDVKMSQGMDDPAVRN